MKWLPIARSKSWDLVKDQHAFLLVTLLIHNKLFTACNTGPTKMMWILDACQGKSNITTLFSQYNLTYSSETLLLVLIYWWELGGHIQLCSLYTLGLFQFRKVGVTLLCPFSSALYSFFLYFHLHCVAMCFLENFLCVFVWLVVSLKEKIGHAVNSC